MTKKNEVLKEMLVEKKENKKIFADNDGDLTELKPKTDKKGEK